MQFHKTIFLVNTVLTTLEVVEVSTNSIGEGLFTGHKKTQVLGTSQFYARSDEEFRRKVKRLFTESCDGHFEEAVITKVFFRKSDAEKFVKALSA